MALVTISNYHHQRDAEVARMALAAEGIEAFVIDETLQVREEDVEAADAVLNRMHGVDDAEDVKPSDTQPWPEPDACEECGSTDIGRRQKWTAFFIVAAFVGAIGYVENFTIPAFFLIVALLVWAIVADAWRCRNCGRTW